LRDAERETTMAKLLVALLATLALTALSLEASAQDKKCPDGQVYNPDTGKCVTPRGSY
jgi:Chitin binding Peritrophin-A domain